MKVNLTGYPLTCAFACITLFTASIPKVWAGESEDFVAKLKTHYQKTLAIKTYSLNYHFLNKQYRSHDYWDYQAPDRVMSVRMVEVDMVKKHFYDNDILYSSSGRLNNFVQFQNERHLRCSHSKRDRIHSN